MLVAHSESCVDVAVLRQIVVASYLKGAFVEIRLQQLMPRNTAALV